MQQDASENASSSNTVIATSSNGTWPSAGADTFRISSPPSWTRSGAGRCWCSRSPSSFPGCYLLSSGGSSSSPTETSPLPRLTKTLHSFPASTTSIHLPDAFCSPWKHNTPSAMAPEPLTRNVPKLSSSCAYRVLWEFSSRLSW